MQVAIRIVHCCGWFIYVGRTRGVAPISRDVEAIGGSDPIASGSVRVREWMCSSAPHRKDVHTTTNEAFANVNGLLWYDAPGSIEALIRIKLVRGSMGRRELGDDDDCPSRRKGEVSRSLNALFGGMPLIWMFKVGSSTVTFEGRLGVGASESSGQSVHPWKSGRL